MAVIECPRALMTRSLHITDKSPWSVQMMGEAAMMGVVFEATAAKIHAQLNPGKKKKHMAYKIIQCHCRGLRSNYNELAILLQSTARQLCACRRLT